MKVNSGNDVQAKGMGGDVVGYTGTATATSATSLTATGTPWVASAYIGHIVVAGSVYGIVTANTTSVLTVDQWYVPGTPGGAAGGTPGGTSVFVILPGQAPIVFIGVTANGAAAVATDTSLPGEITTSGGGLIRKIATFAHSAGVASYTMTVVFTANGSDTLPVTIAKLGAFLSIIAATAGMMVFETLLNATATLTISGDQVTITHTVTN